MKVKKGHKSQMKSPRNTYLSQINDYYNRRLSSYTLIELGATPKYLINYGVPELPLVIKQILQKHMDKKQLHIIDNKRAEMLSRVIGLQLPKALINSSYKKRIPSENKKINKNFQKVRQEDRMPDNNFQFLGKEKMIELMKSQFGYTADKATPEFEFKYTKLGNTSERLEYYNDYYEDHHDLYHSIVAGEEVCLYHVNDGRNRRVEIPGRNAVEQKASVVDKLNRLSQDINSDKDKSQIPRDNNLESQRTPHER